MRASAASRISSAHTAHQPSQAANNNKADDTSPFAQLLAATGAAPKGDKKPADDKDGHDDKTAADQLTAKADKSDAPQATVAPAPQAPVDTKGDTKVAKTEKQDDQPAQDETAAAADPAAVDPAALPQAVIALQQPQQQQQAPAPQAAIDNAEDGVDAAAAATAPTKPVAPTAPAKPQAQTQAPATADAAGDTEATGDTGTDADTDVQQAETAAQPAQPTKAAAKPAKPAPEAIKPNTKDAAAKPATASKTAAADTQDDGAKPAAKPAADAAAPAPAADKPAAAPAHTADNTITAPTLVAPNTAQPATPAAPAPVVTQHVQVTAQPAPNLPALAVEIASKSQAGAKQFDIRLDPAELGRVEVRLSIDATGKASAHLTADQPQTLDLLRKDSTSLTQALRDAGLDVSQDGLNFSLRQQSGDAQQGMGGHGGRSLPRGQMLTASKSLDATQASAAYRAPADGRLDIKV